MIFYVLNLLANTSIYAQNSVLKKSVYLETMFPGWGLASYQLSDIFDVNSGFL